MGPSKLRFLPHFNALQLFTVGIAFGNIICIGILKNVYNIEVDDLAWRWGFGCQAIFAGIMLVGLPFCPESPRWCVQHEKEARGHRAVRRITQSPEGSAPFEALMAETKELVEADRKMGEAKWSDLLQRGIWNRIGIACALMVFQQWSGINAAVSYNNASPIIQWILNLIIIINNMYDHDLSYIIQCGCLSTWVLIPKRRLPLLPPFPRSSTSP